MHLFNRSNTNDLQKAIDELSATESDSAETDSSANMDLGTPAAPNPDNLMMPPSSPAPKSIDGFTRPAVNIPVVSMPPDALSNDPQLDDNLNTNNGGQTMNQDNAIDTILNDANSTTQAEPTIQAKQPAPVEQPSTEPAMPSPDISAPAYTPPAEPAQTSAESAPASPELAQLKSSALTELAPLMDKIDLPAENQFEIYTEVISNNKDTSLVEKALNSAKNIPDDKLKAESLLKLVQLIDTL